MACNDHRHQGGEEYTLVLRALKSDAPPVVRLKRILKSLLRHYEFKAVSITDTTPYPDGTPGVAQGLAEGTEATAGPSGGESPS